MSNHSPDIKNTKQHVHSYRKRNISRCQILHPSSIHNYMSEYNLPTRGNTSKIPFSNCFLFSLQFCRVSVIQSPAAHTSIEGTLFFSS